jgi:CelD/BcsL family acetyltransferase involved in cellulose biosynthesis
MFSTTVETISDLPDLVPLEQEWNSLAAKFENPLLRHEWFLAFAQAYSHLYRPAVFVLRSSLDRSIQAIAPLVTSRRAGFSRLHAWGNWILGEPTSLIYRDEEALWELLSALLRCGLPLSLDRVDATSPIVPALEELRPRSSLLLARTSGSSLWVPLGSDWPSFEASLATNARRRIRTQQRLSKRFGQIELEVAAPDEDTLGPVLEEAFRVESSGWKRQQGTAILTDPPTERFCRLYGRAAAQLGMLRILFLRIGSEAIAVLMAIEYAGRLWEWKFGYDERWRKCSPGILLTHETLRYCCERGLVALEFLGKEELWERLWTNREHPYITLKVYPLASIAGPVVLGQDMGVYAARKAYAAVRSRVFLPQMRLGRSDGDP